MNWNAFLLVLLLGSAVLAMIAGLFIVTWLTDLIMGYMDINYDTAYIISLLSGLLYTLVMGATVAGVLL